MKRAFALFLLLVVAAAFAAAQAERPLLLHNPTISRTHVAFNFANDLWIVPRAGGEARALTSGVGVKTGPVFSPDGNWIAFTGEYDGNTDVYVMPATGGFPTRLTYHPGSDVAVAWTPDGQRVIFRSGRNSYSRFSRLFSVSVDSGLPSEIPLPMAVEGSFSADGARLAYVPLTNSSPQVAWKRYRGGLASKIWIADLADSRIEKLPRDTSNDFNPMWVGDRIYFLSDREGPTSLYAYELASKQVSPALKVQDEIKSASAGAGAIIYEQLGGLSIFDLSTGRSQPFRVTASSDLPALRPQFAAVGERISNGNISATGMRAVVEAHGDILTVPAEKGDIRNLTNTPAVAERDPAWSPDGKWVAYFSDESGEYMLHIAPQDGRGEVKKIGLGDPPSFFYSPVWSPDSKKIAYTDKRLQLWYLDLETKKPVLVDTDTYDSPFRELDPAWAPDSRWLAYTKMLPSRMRAVFVHSLETGKSHQLTDGMSDARYANFDRDGKYLYFAASTDSGPTTGWLDLSSIRRPVTRSLYLIVLRSDLPSPLAPQSDEENAEKKDEKKEEKKEEPAKDAKNAKAAEKDKPREEAKKPEPVRIDLENIGQRILALPLPARNYTGLLTGKAGTIYFVEADLLPAPGPDQGGTLSKWDFEKRKPEKLLDGVLGPRISADGKKLLFRKGKKAFIVALDQPAEALAKKMAESALNLDDMKVYVDPRATWQQMYREVWRVQRDFFYDPGLHGLNLAAMKQKYQPYIDAVASRSDLTYVFRDMLGELVVGHLYISNPPSDTKPAKTGLLGADYRIENGRYRIERIYQGENWNPELKAPLTEPGVNAKPGDYILEVNGRELKGTDNIFSFFQETAGKSVLLKLASDPAGKDARTVSAVPIESEVSLRQRAWIDWNRRKVDELSAGRLAYVYLPNTAGAGYTNFNRYYFAQLDREGAVIDERFNGGGLAADYVIDYLRRPVLSYWTTREGKDFTTPFGSIFGPKAMIINEFAGSGGDALPWYFRRARIGPLVGKRTWGGLIGVYDYPQLIDGSTVTSPRLAFYSPDGEWDVENRGVPPDVEVEYEPQAWRAGRDPQLERAVEVVLEQLKREPLPVAKKPAFPNYHAEAPVEAQGKE